jgi:hypothetical protein
MALKGWVSPSTSVRSKFAEQPSVVHQPDRSENRITHSKNTRRYGRNETTGEQPADLYRDPVNPDSPIRHHNAEFRHHVETVGHVPNTGGQWADATHPNAEAKAAGNARHTHRPLEPVGQTHSKTGGAHGEPQTRPESDTRRGAKQSTPQLGTLNTRRDRNRE